MLSLRVVEGLMHPESLTSVWVDSDHLPVSSLWSSVLVNLVLGCLGWKFCFLLVPLKVNLLASFLARGLIVGVFSVGLLTLICVFKSWDECERPIGGGRLREGGSQDHCLLPQRSTLKRRWSCNQTINQSASQLVNQFTNKPIHQSTIEWTLNKYPTRACWIWSDR